MNMHKLVLNFLSVELHVCRTKWCNPCCPLKKKVLWCNNNFISFYLNLFLDVLCSTWEEWIMSSKCRKKAISGFLSNFVFEGHFVTFLSNNIIYRLPSTQKKTTFFAIFQFSHIFYSVQYKINTNVEDQKRLFVFVFFFTNTSVYL